MSDQTIALYGSLLAFTLCSVLVVVSHYYCRTAVKYYFEARNLLDEVRRPAHESRLAETCLACDGYGVLDGLEPCPTCGGAA